MFYIIQYIEWILQLIEFIVNLIIVIFYLMIYKIRYVGMSLFYMIGYIFDLFKKITGYCAVYVWKMISEPIKTGSFFYSWFTLQVTYLIVKYGYKITFKERNSN